jgi:hypothetical protein
MFSKGKQHWSHIKILKDSPKQYEYILQLIMKVCITFYALVFIMKFHILYITFSNKYFDHTVGMLRAQ